MHMALHYMIYRNINIVSRKVVDLDTTLTTSSTSCADASLNDQSDRTTSQGKVKGTM